MPPRVRSVFACFQRLARFSPSVLLGLSVLLWSTTFAMGTRPVLAALRVDEEAPHASLWRSLYAEMPGCWKTPRLVVLRELSDADMDRLIARKQQGAGDAREDDSVIDGCYENGGQQEDDSATITLRDTLSGEEAVLVFTHEYGHHVWDEILTNGERARYERLWRQQKRAHRLVTEYAGDSEEEGFAEAFAYYLRRPTRLRQRDPASWQFLNDIAARVQSHSDSADENSLEIEGER